MDEATIKKSVADAANGFVYDRDKVASRIDSMLEKANHVIAFTRSDRERAKWERIVSDIKKAKSLIEDNEA